MPLRMPDVPDSRQSLGAQPGQGGNPPATLISSSVSSIVPGTWETDSAPVFLCQGHPAAAEQAPSSFSPAGIEMLLKDLVGVSCKAPLFQGLKTHNSLNSCLAKNMPCFLRGFPSFQMPRSPKPSVHRRKLWVPPPPHTHHPVLPFSATPRPRQLLSTQPSARSPVLPPVALPLVPLVQHQTLFSLK